jgi:type II secretory pathway component PulM
MNQLIEQIRTFLRQRTPNERWLLGLAVWVVVLTLVYVSIARPLGERLTVRETQLEQLEAGVKRAVHLAGGVQQLQISLRAVETRISPDQKTNLFTLLEAIAEQAQVKDSLDSIKPKQPSGNEKYPETRVEVSLKSATLEQIVQLLYRIETAPVHLIVRSIRIKARPDGSGRLDVSLSVSSFERA